MVAVGAFPIAKLGALLLKQISKPLANALKQQAKNSPVFSRYVCMAPARFYNACEIKAKMWVLQTGKPVNIQVLNDEMAVELGANLLGETIIFLIASGVVILEYNRSSKKEAAKEEAKRQEIEQLQDTIRELFIQTEEQAAHIRELTRKLGDLETRVVQKPWVPKKETKEPEEPKKSPPTLPPLLQRKPNEISEGSQPAVINVNFIDRDEISRISNEILLSELPQHKEDEILSFELPQHKEEDVTAGLVLNAVSQVEKEFWIDPNAKRKEGILIKALNHIYKDVYRLPMSFT